MSKKNTPAVFVVGLTGLLWVVPSIGSQGLGTVGEPYGHADRALVQGNLAPAAVRTALRAADARVEATLAR